MGFGASTIVGNLMVDLVQADVDGIVDGIAGGSGGNADLYDLNQNLASIRDQLNGSASGNLHDGGYSLVDYLSGGSYNGPLYQMEQYLSGSYSGPLYDGNYNLIQYLSGTSYNGPLYQMEQYISGNYYGPFYDGSYNLVGYLANIYSILSQLTFDGSGNLNVKSN